jgi:hypothetical protein
MITPERGAPGSQDSRTRMTEHQWLNVHGEVEWAGWVWDARQKK